MNEYTGFQGWLLTHLPRRWAILVITLVTSLMIIAVVGGILGVGVFIIYSLVSIFGAVGATFIIVGVFAFLFITASVYSHIANEIPERKKHDEDEPDNLT
jgi:fatty acid desaturase